MILAFEVDESGGRLKKWNFFELPTRPMIQFDLRPAKMTGSEVKSWIQSKIKAIPGDSIVKLKIYGKPDAQVLEVLRAASLRALAPPTINIEARYMDHSFYTAGKDG